MWKLGGLGLEDLEVPGLSTLTPNDLPFKDLYGSFRKLGVPYFGAPYNKDPISGPLFPETPISRNQIEEPREERFPGSR